MKVACIGNMNNHSVSMGRVDAHLLLLDLEASCFARASDTCALSYRAFARPLTGWAAVPALTTRPRTGPDVRDPWDRCGWVGAPPGGQREWVSGAAEFFRPGET